MTELYIFIVLPEKSFKKRQFHAKTVTPFLGQYFSLGEGQTKGLADDGTGHQQLKGQCHNKIAGDIAHPVDEPEPPLTGVDAALQGAI